MRKKNVAQDKQDKKEIKKVEWTPSSKYAAQPINKLPKDTYKSKEMRAYMEKERDKNKVN